MNQELTKEEVEQVEEAERDLLAKIEEQAAAKLLPGNLATVYDGLRDTRRRLIAWADMLEPHAVAADLRSLAVNRVEQVMWKVESAAREAKGLPPLPTYQEKGDER